MKKNIIKILLLAVVLIGQQEAFTDSVVNLTESEAKDFVNTHGKEAFSTLTSKEFPKKDREKKFEVILDKVFDIKAIGRFSLGRYWRNLNKDQREKYFSALKGMLIRSYVGKFADFPGSTFRIAKVDIGAGSGVTVSTVVDCPGKGTFNVGWKLYKTKTNDIRITDVIVDGVSMGTTQRAEFGSVMLSLNNNVEEFIKHISRIGEKSK